LEADATNAAVACVRKRNKPKMVYDHCNLFLPWKNLLPVNIFIAISFAAHNDDGGDNDVGDVDGGGAA